eukprot:gene3191-6295_t
MGDVQLTCSSHVTEGDRIAYLKSLIQESSLPLAPERPILPDLHSFLSEIERINRIQAFIESFEYNYTGKPFIKFTKSRGMSNVVHVAKEIIQEALPIQCLEAVFIGCYLTANIRSIDRIPISFKSRMNESIHRHIVLAIRHNNKWGAIGISRRTNLMNKDIHFDSVKELIDNYIESYQTVNHRLIKVYLGLPFSHDIFCDTPVKWRVLHLKLYPYDEMKITRELNMFCHNMQTMFDTLIRTGYLPSELATVAQLVLSTFHVCAFGTRAFDSITLRTLRCPSGTPTATPFYSNMKSFVHRSEIGEVVADDSVLKFNWKAEAFINNVCGRTGFSEGNRDREDRMGL